jgi:hypothetical protein
MAKSSQEHLREQCGFLKRSVQSVLDGHSEEAVRVATTIRVLVHKTKTATPLLEQLRPDYLRLTILDTPTPTPSGPGRHIPFYIGVGLTLGTNGVRPIFDNGPLVSSFTLDEWWNKTVLIFTDLNARKTVFTRRDLILTL